MSDYPEWKFELQRRIDASIREARELKQRIAENRRIARGAVRNYREKTDES